jgi:hypothetical protein
MAMRVSRPRRQRETRSRAALPSALGVGSRSSARVDVHGALDVSYALARSEYIVDSGSAHPADRACECTGSPSSLQPGSKHWWRRSRIVVDINTQLRRDNPAGSTTRSVNQVQQRNSNDYHH